MSLSSLLATPVTTNLASPISSFNLEVSNPEIKLRKQPGPIVDMRFLTPFIASNIVVAATDATVPGSTAYIVPTAFPTSVYSSYYGNVPTSELMMRDILLTSVSQARANAGASTSHL